MDNKYVIGVDFGSDSVRAIIENTADGSIIGCGICPYPRWKQGLYQHPEQGIFRQHPLDYLEALESCVQEAVSCLSREQRERIVGIGVDTTGSTPAPMNRDGVLLALTEKYAKSENAMFYLWKDHSAVWEAEEINEVFTHGSNIDYGKYQGKYCAEWFWAKILHAVRKDPDLCKDAYTWVEHSDWIVGLLCGNTKPETMYHSACAAGHKALWHSEWKGLPPVEILDKLDPYLSRVRDHYGRIPESAVSKAGELTEKWAEKFGVPAGIAVSGSSFDAHAGAVGAGIRKGTLVCTIGTSAVDMLVERKDDLKNKDIRNYGGQAENSILPDFVGIETGQAAFGDIFAWFKKILMWPVIQSKKYLSEDEFTNIYLKMDETILDDLSKAAENLPEEPFPIALDWFNGRRYPDADDFQQAMLADLSLGTDAPQIYRSLVFAAICGLKRIVEGFQKEDIVIERLTAVGGISKKSPYVMQMMADTLGKRISILDADQTCAVGAAIYAATAAGVYGNIEKAIEVMAAKCVKEYVPDPKKHLFYQKRYKEYLELTNLGDKWKSRRY